MEILIRDTPEEGAQVAAKLFKKILSTRPQPVIGLATGGTPLRLYRADRSECLGGVHAWVGRVI